MVLSHHRAIESLPCVLQSRKNTSNPTHGPGSTSHKHSTTPTSRTTYHRNAVEPHIAVSLDALIGLDQYDNEHILDHTTFTYIIITTSAEGLRQVLRLATVAVWLGFGDVRSDPCTVEWGREEGKKAERSYHAIKERPGGEGGRAAVRREGLRERFRVVVIALWVWRELVNTGEEVQRAQQLGGRNYRAEWAFRQSRM